MKGEIRNQKSERRKENEYERLNAAEQRLIATESLVNVASPRLNAAEQRLKATEQRLIATASQVNVAEQRLKDSQSQGDD